MNGGLEGAADAVTAGLAGRAVEPRVGNTRGHAEHGGTCLNCGTALIGEHCHRCGQSAHVHRSVGAIGHEIAHGVFHFEGKIWRTLPLLAFRPGELTRRYAAGERAKFVSPLAMFLFSVFLMFAIVANLPGYKFGGEDFLKPGVQESLGEIRAKVAADRKAEQAKRAEDQRQLAAERSGGKPSPERIASRARQINESSTTIRDLSRIEAAIPATRGEVAKPVAGENWLEQRFRHARENPELVSTR